MSLESRTCLACGKDFIVITGHSCSDTETTVQVRANLAKEMLARQALQKELDELKRYLVPVAHWVSGSYNKWRSKNTKVPGWSQACEYIHRYIMKDE